MSETRTSTALDIENALISLVLDTGDVASAVGVGLTSEWFEDPLHVQGWEWLIEHWKEYAEVPSIRAFERTFPDFEVDRQVEEPYNYLLDELRQRRKVQLTGTGLALSVEEFNAEDPDVDNVLSTLSTMLTTVGQEAAGSKDTNLVETYADRLEAYDILRQNGGAIRGIPTGFTLFDKYLSGLHKEQLITLIGLPKSGKSTALLKVAQNCHDAGKVPLFVGFEMSNQEQEARFDAMAAKIDHSKLMNGQLKKEEFERLSSELKARKNMHPFLLSSDARSAMTISGLTGKAHQYRPDILFVDGLYMMTDEITGESNTPQALTNLTRGLKRLSQNLEIPIVGTTQVLPWKYSKSRGLTADAIGYSSSFAQDSDVIIGVESVEGADNVKKMSIVIARNAPPKATLIVWDWERGEFQEAEASDADELVTPESVVDLSRKMGYKT